MGILSAIGGIISGAIGFITDGITYVFNAVKSIFGIKPSPPSEKIRSALRQQWLELAPEEESIPGVEWEGEVYYETPK